MRQFCPCCKQYISPRLLNQGLNLGRQTSASSNRGHAWGPTGQWLGLFQSRIRSELCRAGLPLGAFKVSASLTCSKLNPFKSRCCFSLACAAFALPRRMCVEYRAKKWQGPFMINRRGLPSSRILFHVHRQHYLLVSSTGTLMLIINGPGGQEMSWRMYAPDLDAIASLWCL